jgi:hypothetical protein
MTRPKNKPPNSTTEADLVAALEYYNRHLTQSKPVSIRQAAKLFNIPRWETLRGRISRHKSRQLEIERRQRLSAIEEKVLSSSCLQVFKWGWPAKIPRLRSLATDLLVAKGDLVPLSLN